jgi:hypothetical protein
MSDTTNPIAAPHTAPLHPIPITTADSATSFAQPTTATSFAQPTTATATASASASASASAAAVTAAASAATATAPAANANAAAAANWFGRNVYVRNLPPVNPLTFEMPSERHIQALFSRFGTIERLRVIRDRVTSFPVGHALILFTSAESAQAAIHFINNNFHGMTLWPSFNKPSATLWLPKEVFG